MGRKRAGVTSRPLVIGLVVAFVALTVFLLWPVNTDHPMGPQADRRDRDRFAALGLVILLIDYWDEKGDKVSPVGRAELEAWAANKELDGDLGFESLKDSSFEWEVNPSCIGKRFEDIPDDQPMILLRGHPAYFAITPGGRLVSTAR